MNHWIQIGICRYTEVDGIAVVHENRAGKFAVSGLSQSGSVGWRQWNLHERCLCSSRFIHGKSPDSLVRALRRWLFDLFWLSDLLNFLPRLISWLLWCFLDRPIDWLIARSIDWLIDCSVDWLIDWLLGRLIDWLGQRSIDRLIDWLLGRLIDWLGQRSIDWLIDWGRRSINWLIDWGWRSNDRLIDWLGAVVDWLIDWLIGGDG